MLLRSIASLARRPFVVTLAKSANVSPIIFPQAVNYTRPLLGFRGMFV